MKKFTVPTIEQVSEKNKNILENIKNEIGTIPNFYAYIAKNGNALADYLYLENRESSLNIKEKEVINLITSQINGCYYCLSAHTMIAKMNGFSEEETIEIRKGSASFDSKLDILVKVSASIVNNKGLISETEKQTFFEAGFTEENLTDAIFLIGERTITNYIHNVADYPIDFPIAQQL